MLRSIVGVVIALMCGTTLSLSAQEPDPVVAKMEADRIAAVNKAMPSVVAIFASGGNGGGSGVVITPDGYALSNFHVTKPAGNFMKCGMADGKLYDAVIVGIDPVGDVALIKMHGKTDFIPAEMADSDQVRTGDFCFAMGNPFLLATDFTPTVSYGVVSGVNRYQYPAGTFLEYADCIQTDAAINPGNSGGPLFDAQGRLIGINGRGSFEKRGRVNVGVGYAISINQIKKFMGALRSGRVLDHATLGAQFTTSDSGKVIVSNILEESDAWRRGLKPDDELISFAGRPIKTVNSFKTMLGTIPRDWRVPMVIKRNNQEVTLFVRLKGVHREDELLSIMEGSENPEERPKGRPGEPAPKPKMPKPAPGKLPKLPFDKLINKDNGPPADLKKQYEARAGYSNYYFNKFEQDRLWNNLKKHGDFSSLTSDWKLSGKQGGNTEFTLEFSKTLAKSILPTGDSEIDLGDDLEEAVNPPGSGGMLAALHLWRKFIVGGPSQYGLLQYAGQMPWPNQPELYDVLVGTSGGVDMRFYFDTKTGQIAALELFLNDTTDPCEITFDSWQTIAGRQWPDQFTVKQGDRVYGSFQLTKVEAEAATKPAEKTDK
jgi:serine protease Do